jgi:hypothetical protein
MGHIYFGVDTGEVQEPRIRKYLALLTPVVSSAFGGQDIPVTINVLAGGEQCTLFSKAMRCDEVAKFLRDAEVPLDHAFGFMPKDRRSLNHAPSASRI